MSSREPGARAVSLWLWLSVVLSLSRVIMKTSGRQDGGSAAEAS